MKKLLALIISLTLFIPSISFAAIAFDNTTNGLGVATFSHTTSGSNRMLFVGCIGDTTDTMTGITYGGVAMTRDTSAQMPANRFTYLFELVNPALGANNVVVSGPALTYCSATSYTGVKQTSPTEASTTASAALNTILSVTTTLTTVSDNSWAINYTWANQTATSTAGTGRMADATFFQYWSDIPKTPAGSVTLGWSTSVNSGFASNMVSIAPFTTAPVVSACHIRGLGLCH